MLGVKREWGFASGLSGISYSLPKFPNPEKTDGNRFSTSVVVEVSVLVSEATRILLVSEQ